MNQKTARNISKAVQLKHVKEKLHEWSKNNRFQMKHKKSHKKINLVKSLKNLMKREQRK